MSGRRKVLVVDDDPAVTAYVEAKLSRDFDVVATNDPRHAVRLASAEQPHVILCDIDMPGMSGGDVAAALARDPMTAFIPLVYLTALVSPEEASELEGQVGGRPGVSKRAQLSELVGVIDKVTRR
jgi:putative two-component system response regulator